MMRKRALMKSIRHSRSAIPAILISLFCITVFACNNMDSPHSNIHVSLSRLIDSLGIPKDQLHLLVSKSSYRLSVMHDTDVIRSYKIVLGSNPEDDKRMEGDMCTPEGVFLIRDLYPHERWTYFIWINYPTDVSQERFNALKASGEIPETATIGGEIGIHGVPKGRDFYVDKGINWTHGCMSLNTDGIKDLYPVCFAGMKVRIEK